MRFARVIVRFPIDERGAVDRLRHRYFDETRRGLSRASVVRILVHRALIDADARSAADVLGEVLPALAPRAASMPARSAHAQGAKFLPTGGTVCIIGGMGSYSAADVIQLPRLTAPGAIALGEKVLTAGKARKKEMTKGIAAVLGLLTSAHTALKAAVRDQVGTVAEEPAEDGAESDAVSCDRRIDACWSGLNDFLTAFSKLPDVPEAAEAQALKGLIFNDGLKFILYVYDLEWAESDTRIERIKAQGLDKRITALGGGIFLKALFAAHIAYGKALGLTKVQTDTTVPVPNLRDAMDTFNAALRKYVVKVMGSVEDDEPKTQALADALLAPLATWAVGPTKVGGKGAGKDEGAKEEDAGAEKPSDAKSGEAAKKQDAPVAGAKATDAAGAGKPGAAAGGGKTP